MIELTNVYSVCTVYLELREDDDELDNQSGRSKYLEKAILQWLLCTVYLMLYCFRMFFNF